MKPWREHGIRVQYAGVSIAVYGRFTHSKNLVGSTNGMESPYASKVVGPGPKIRVEIDASVHVDLHWNE